VAVAAFSALLGSASDLAGPQPGWRPGAQAGVADDEGARW
jgi:hypothetical protein